MKNFLLCMLAVTALPFSGVAAEATDLTIHLNGSATISQTEIRYRCDAQGVKLGLPSGIFTVRYINGGGNSLAVVPVNSVSLIFANVTSGSGARYAAGPLIWWDAAGRSVTLSSDSLAGKSNSTCQRVQ
ncbi:hypothetical protein BH10ACI4_BH10ACI4_08160 [soil metagenome]